MHLDTYYPIYFNRPATASQRSYRLLHHLLSHGYEETIPVNASDSLGTFHRDDQVTRIDYVWSCPMLKGFALTSYIFDAQDTCSSDHNPIITYFDDSLLQWESFSTCTDSLCNVSPSTFSTWHINQQCEYLHSRIVKAANASLPSVTVGNQFTPTMPKDLEALTQHYRFLSLYLQYPPWFPSSQRKRLSRLFHSTRRRITLDRVFIDHPTQPKLLTDPHDIDNAVINHFQNSVPIKSTPPINISALPERWSSAYRPMDDVDSSIYNSLLDPPTLDEWLSTVSSMPNDKAPGPSMITYEMLKHLGPNTSALILILVQSCLRTADIPDLWRQAMVFPIPKPHEWKCQLKNTRPITLLEVIRKSLVKLFYNRLASILASNEVLRGGNFAGLPGGSCRDPIVVLESIIHDAHVNKSPL
ncbi:reverse transcriptase family protein [Rhizophagus irregularis DAOM 181602=DAOM 197198]|nr:reverse transcriptase family protein [Rhizophagus irregularis DAOM 181602=DAOM 197198]